MFRGRSFSTAWSAHLALLLLGHACLGAGDPPEGGKEIRRIFDALNAQHGGSPSGAIRVDSSSSSSSSEGSHAARQLMRMQRAGMAEASSSGAGPSGTSMGVPGVPDEPFRQPR